MDKQTAERLKELMLKEKETLESELRKIVADDFDIKADSSDTSDEKAHSVTASDEEKALARNIKTRLKEIDETLKKIKAGTFGVCELCKTQIELKRLEVVPAAKHCFNCAKKAVLV